MYDVYEKGAYPDSILRAPLYWR